MGENSCEVFEDGSAVCTVYGEGNVAWDCATMGNMICGTVQPVPMLPDTATGQPDGLDITGLIVVVILLVTFAHQWAFTPRDRR